MSYSSELLVKQYMPNFVIRIAGIYFCVRSPDSGLSTDSRYANLVAGLTLNPTTIDIRRVSTTIASYTFKLTDVNGVVSAIIDGDAKGLIRTNVDIWVGRSKQKVDGVDFDFADYYALPTTQIKKVDYVEGGFLFSVTEAFDRMSRPLYAIKTRLFGDILAGTTTIVAQDDISAFPTTGLLKIENEFISYTGTDTVLKRFTGCIRGEQSSIPADHKIYSDVFFTEVLTDNPINIIMRLLSSNGGGGTYDTLVDGLGLADSLLDITGMEVIRDNLFPLQQYKVFLYNIENALKYIENTLLASTNLRFTQSIDSKITLAVLDKAVFVPTSQIINEDSISSSPKWSVDSDKIVNQIEISWDYDETIGAYKNVTPYSDADSITIYEKSTPLKFQFPAVRTELNGQDLMDRYATRLLIRLSTPRPEISFSTHIDQSLKNIGDKVVVDSTKIPNFDGTLDFNSEMEIVSRGVNHQSGEVQLKLQFTSFTGINSGYISPSDLITSYISQKRVNVALGRSSLYKIGYYMRLFDTLINDYTADAPNKIVGFDTSGDNLITQDGDDLVTQDGDNLVLNQGTTEDTIIFQDDWTTVLADGRYKIRFANYSETDADQKRYAFISDDGNDFPDGKPTYRITY